MLLSTENEGRVWQPRGMRQFRQANGAEVYARQAEWPMVALSLMYLSTLLLPYAHPLTPAERHAIDGTNIVLRFNLALGLSALVPLVTREASRASAQPIDPEARPNPPEAGQQQSGFERRLRPLGVRTVPSG